MNHGLNADHFNDDAANEAAAERYAIGHIGGPTHSGSSYLQATVDSASPARLRLMLIERGVEVATALSDGYRTGENTGSNDLSIKLFDILSELLTGVTGSTNKKEGEICDQVADLYVFLMQHLLAAEQISDSSSVTEIAAVLQIEAETWRMACAVETDTHTRMTSGGAGLNFTA